MRVTVPNSGQFGIVSDQAPQELPINAWSDGSNFRFRDGYAERFLGQRQIFDAPVITPYFITPYATTTSRFWVHAGLTSVYVDDGTTRTEITGTAPTGAIDDRWTGGSLNGVLVLNNGKDVPTFWGGDVGLNLATLTGWDAAWRAASVRPFKNYLVALDVTKGATRFPHMVKWSSAADPGTIPASWDETDPAVDAGELDQAETPDLMVDQLPLGDVNIIYKERSMYSMQYIGGQFIFRFARLPGDYGMLTRGCAVQVPNGHVVLASGDVVIHNGQGPQSILTGKMRDWLFSRIDSTNYRRCFVTSNPARNEVWICFPESGQSTCTKALVWNWVDNTFGVRELTAVTYGAAGQVNYTALASWASDTDSWDSDVTSWQQDGFSPTDARLLLCATTPTIGLVDASAQEFGANLTTYIERTGLSLDAPDRVKTLSRIIPRVDAVAGTVISIEFGASMDAEVEPTWNTAIPYTVGTTYKADGFVTGRFLAVRFGSTSAQPWRIRSYDMEVMQRGTF